MFDIRKIQENVIYEAVKAESNADIANEVVYGNGQLESNPNWVKCAMQRLESKFEFDTILFQRWYYGTITGRAFE